MGYTVNGIEYDYFSSKNQAILDKLVSREVFCCVTSEMEYIIKCILDGVNTDDAPFEEEEFYEALYCQECCPKCGDSFGYEELSPIELNDEDFHREETWIDSLDDVGEGYLCPVCGTGFETVDEARKCCADEIVYKCKNCGEVLNKDDYDNIEPEPAEVFEWWIVDPLLGDNLKAYDEVVLDGWGKSFWGRCTTGQSISIDYVIAQIAYDHGWLEGQPNEWHVP